MAARLVFLETDRKLPSLNRGWRTPDPSPTRDAAGLPGWDLKLCLEEAWSKEGCSTSGRSTVPIGWTSRTPSPSPTRQQLPHAAKMCVQAIEDQMPTPRMQLKLRTEGALSTEGSSTSGRSMAPMGWTSRTPSPSPTRQRLVSHDAKMCAQDIGDQMPTPRMQLNLRTEEALSMECSSTSGRSMVPMDWTSRTPSPSPTRQQLTSHAAKLGYPHSSDGREVEIEAPPKPVEEPRPQKVPMAQKAKQKETSLARTPGEKGKSKALETSALCMSTVSIGSVGHPFSCAEPCKYVMKKNRGCKDGAACNRCHLCEWKKQGPRKAKGARSSPSDSPSGQPDSPSAQPEQH